MGSQGARHGEPMTNIKTFFGGNTMFEDELSTTEETSPIEGQEVESADVQDQEVEQEVSNEETPEESQVDEGQGELIAGKFKSQDDLIKAYKNLEKEFHKSRQQQSQPEQDYQQPVQQQIDDPNSVFWDMFQQSPFQTIQWLINQGVQEQVAPIYEKQSQNDLAQNIFELTNESPEFSQINTDDGLNKLLVTVHEIADELGNPQLANNPSKRILRMAAQEAFGNKAAIYQQAKKKGYEEAEQNRKAKQGLGAPSTNKPKQTEKSPEEQLADMIVSAGRSGGIFG